jgi:hypothetical protein
VYLQHKVRQLEDELESASKGKGDQGVGVAAFGAPAAASEQSFVAPIAQPATHHELPPKPCVMCQRNVAHSDKSELRYPRISSSGITISNR